VIFKAFPGAGKKEEEKKREKRKKRKMQWTKNFYAKKENILTNPSKNLFFAGPSLPTNTLFF
jgi:hypothetical protein